MKISRTSAPAARRLRKLAVGVLALAAVIAVLTSPAASNAATRGGAVNGGSALKLPKGVRLAGHC